MKKEEYVSQLEQFVLSHAFSYDMPNTIMCNGCGASWAKPLGTSAEIAHITHKGECAVVEVAKRYPIEGASSWTR